MTVELTDIVQDALQRPVPPEARALANNLAEEYGSSIMAVLFYGSCLRDQTADGVLDFYILVDSYRSFHKSWFGAVANALLSPTVTYRDSDTARAKIAIISASAFAGKMRPTTADTTIWARFCQPTALLYSRDAEASGLVCEAISDAIATAAVWAVRLGPPNGMPPALWTSLFSYTYGAELRVEDGDDRSTKIYQQASNYFDSVLGPALERAAKKSDQQTWGSTAQTGPNNRYRRTWKRKRIAGKCLNIMRLIKASFTFDQKIEYIEWKVERHTGQALELSDFQRRHPLIAAPGVLWKLWRKGAIR